MLNIFRKMAAITLAALLTLTAAPASANDAEYVSYTIEKNDTLYGIAERYLVSTESAIKLGEYNRIRFPRRLQINSTLRIPRELLRYNDVELEVDSFSGPVEVAGNAPQRRQILREGQVVETRQNGFVTFVTRFGGRISLPSNTSATLIRARRYVLGNTLDVDFKVERGRATATSPRLEGQDRLRMRTPIAVTAVRGTEFRIAYDPETGEFSLTEVTEGEVSVSVGEQERTAAAGFGIASTAAGVGEPEELLPSPVIVDGTAIQTAETLDFLIDTVPSATRYRVQLARDANFLDVVGELLTDGGEIALPGIADGRYFVRARAISPSGLEGNSDAYSFRRKRLGVAARHETGDDYDGFKFGWRPEGEGTNTYAFQLWAESAPDVLLVDETGLAVTELVLTDLSAGIYQWRVAVAQADEEEGLLKIWAPAQRLVVGE